MSWSDDKELLLGVCIIGWNSQKIKIKINLKSVTLHDGHGALSPLIMISW